MKKLITLLVLSFFAITSNAQTDLYEHRGNDSKVRLRSQMIGDEVSISAEKSNPGYYSIYLEFDKTNYYSGVRDIFKIIESSSVELIRFKKDPEKGLPGYVHSYYPGAVNSKIKHEFAYRLPFADGIVKKFSISRHDDSNKYVGRVVYKFNAENGDDVYAMRKGIVVGIEDATWYREGVANNMTLRKANKLIRIEHVDGSIAHYYSIQDGTVTVALGDVVFPDEIIGKAGTLNDERYYIMISICYLTCPMKGVVPDFTKVEYRYIEPFFATPSGTAKLNENTEAVCKAGDDLITTEMTKREKKNRNKN